MMYAFNEEQPVLLLELVPHITFDTALSDGGYSKAKDVVAVHLMYCSFDENYMPNAIGVFEQINVT